MAEERASKRGAKQHTDRKVLSLRPQGMSVADDALGGEVESIFDDPVQALADDGERVRVEFDRVAWISPDLNHHPVGRSSNVGEPTKTRGRPLPRRATSAHCDGRRESTAARESVRSRELLWSDRSR